MSTAEQVWPEDGTAQAIIEAERYAVHGGRYLVRDLSAIDYAASSLTDAISRKGLPANH